MTERRYTAEAIRELIRQLEVPMIAVRYGSFEAVNAAYAKLLGGVPEDFEGKPYAPLIRPEERRRMEEFSARKATLTHASGRHYITTVIHTPQGRALALEAYIQVLEAEEGERFSLVTFFPRADEQSELDLIGVLVDTSALLVSKHAQTDVRAAAVSAFEAAGLAARFYVRSGERFESAGPPLSSFRPEYAADALRLVRPVFSGGEGLEVPGRVYLPLAEDGLEAGVLFLSGPGIKTRHAFALSLFGRSLAAALANAGLYDDARRRLAETRLLLELARTTSGTLELNAVLEVACDALVKLLDVSNCFIMLYEPASQNLLGAAASAKHRENFRDIRIDVHDPVSVAARVARERRPLTVSPERLHELARPDLVARFSETALAGLPLVARNDLVGVVILDETRGPREFSREWLELAEATAGQIALSIANARLYQSLRTSYAELAETRAEMVRQERLAALGELSAAVAHEVRNPLAVIFNAVSSLRKSQVKGGDSAQLLDILAEESDRLNRIVNDLLDFARPRALALEPEDVGQVIRESLDTAASFPRVPGGGAVRFEAEVEPGLPRVRLDRRLMRQALVNIAVNAVQAMPRGGRIRVRASREVVENREEVKIEVADEGGGIAPEVVGRIFEPFFTTKAQGTGLGLAVVKRILDEHHARVDVSSVVGQGTTFHLRLPVGQVPKGAAGTV